MSTAPEIAGWNHTYSGKVRDLYAPSSGDDDRMLVVASDRVSAFDHVLEPGIPGKGALLTRLSMWWFSQLHDVPNHIAGEPPAEVAERAMLVRSLDMLPIECVVRGYITGSGWLEYQE
jgi:phosphoribosylaminoimidazole-succinocarboxamide synthase